ncbi:HSF-type DNA-binding-domain-containing protein [Coprinopsis sp. MPI-PUGE-AT-0042]|nr:HSF-type DNA-binding-domain-containing protein [Coprinopsis sp. MPI-PUGE-AT-0042]KAH6887330.1 HSF-type DNA-binding-domain-containing protein [Coprinopsis sp. MPI-PUGE-AT-0042]
MSNIGGSKTPESGLTRGHHQGDSMPLASDFVKKLYNILEDTAVQSVVSWGPKGDCFVVKDVNQFSKTILPRVFNHSNFASFVRQLNKYDFHKVKSMGNERFGEDAWAFRHPDFLANRPDAVEKIKRKVPGQCVTQTIDAATALAIVQQQQQAAATAAFLGGSSTEPSFSAMNPSVGGLMSEIRGLRDDNEDVRRRLRTLEKDHRDVLVKMISFQQAMAHQNGLMQSAVAYMLGGNSSHQESPHDGISESTQENLQFISQQLQQQYRAPPPYSTQSPQPQYGGSGGYGKPSGGRFQFFFFHRPLLLASITIHADRSFTVQHLFEQPRMRTWSATDRHKRPGNRGIGRHAG